MINNSINNKKKIGVVEQKNRRNNYEMDKQINILIIKDGEIIPITKDDRKMRVSHLMEYLKNKNYKCTWITTNFLHSEKRFLNNRKINKRNGYIRLFKSLGYYRNTSPRRFIHTIVYSYKVFIYILQTRDRYTHILLSYPTPETLFFVFLALKIIKKPLILDIRDKWPPNADLGFIYLLYERIVSYFLSRISFKSPLFILSVSRDLFSWFVARTPNCINYKSAICEIGCNQEYSYKKDLKKGKEIKKLKFIYIGSLGINYDIKNMVKKLVELSEKEKNQYEINIIGTGEYEADLNIIHSNNCKIRTHGFKNMIEINKLLAVSHIGLVPHKIDGLIPNKIGEYLSNGLYILSTVKGECSDILKTYKIGYTVNREFNNLDKAMLQFSKMNSDEIYKNSKKLYMEKFYTPIIYNEKLKKLNKFILKTN